MSLCACVCISVAHPPCLSAPHHSHSVNSAGQILKKRNTLILNAPPPMVVPTQPVVAPNVVAFSQPPQQVQVQIDAAATGGSGREPARRPTLLKVRPCVYCVCVVHRIV